MSDGLKTAFGVLVHEHAPVGFVTRDHAIRCAQNVGKAKGYAVALHGSQIKDIDLVAVPWTEHAAETSPGTLAALIAYSLPGVVELNPNSQHDEDAGTEKPHGRIAFVIRPFQTFGADHWYIDLSVMPTGLPQTQIAAAMVALGSREVALHDLTGQWYVHDEDRAEEPLDLHDDPLTALLVWFEGVTTADA